MVIIFQKNQEDYRVTDLGEAGEGIQVSVSKAGKVNALVPGVPQEPNTSLVDSNSLVTDISHSKTYHLPTLPGGTGEQSPPRQAF